MPDRGQIGIEWLPIADIMNLHVYPLEMRPYLHKMTDDEESVPVYLGYGM